MGDFFKNVVVPALTVVTALLAAWVNYSVSTVKSDLDLQKAKLDKQQTSLNRMKHLAASYEVSEGKGV
jgi:hypothetical protein